MFVTSETDREGLLVAVISGGRPRLSERPTAKFLKDLEESGFRNIIWVVSEKDAPSYERDDYEVCVYSNQCA